MFRLTFLGTSSGVPTKHRNVSALAVEYFVQNPEAKSHPWLLVDCGEGTQHQLLKSRLSLADLSAIFITHTHGDHCYGLVGLLASLSLHGRKTALTLVAPREIWAWVQMTLSMSQTFLNYAIDFVATESLVNQAHLPLLTTKEQNLHIKVMPVSHRCPSYAFRFEQSINKCRLDTQKLTNLGIDKAHWAKVFKAEDERLTLGAVTISPKEFITHHQSELTIVISGDNDTPELLTEFVCGADLLVHEATYTDDIKQKVAQKLINQGAVDPKHSSAKMVAQFAQNVGIDNLILTHFSARYAPFCDKKSTQPNMGNILYEAKNYFDGKLILAEDFLSVLLTDKGVFTN